MLNTTPEKKGTTKIVIFAAFIILIMIGAVFLSLKQKKDKVPYALTTQVKIYTEGGYGTGTIIAKDEDEIILVSDHHVLSDWNENGKVVFYNGDEAFGQQFGGDAKLDLNFLSIPRENIPDKTFEGINQVDITYSPAEVSSTKEGVQDRLFITIYDIFNDTENRGTIEETSTYIYDLDRILMYGHCKACEGMSGAGIFDEDDKCIGILLAGGEDDEIAAISNKDIIKCIGENSFLW